MWHSSVQEGASILSWKSGDTLLGSFSVSCIGTKAIFVSTKRERHSLHLFEQFDVIWDIWFLFEILERPFSCQQIGSSPWTKKKRQKDHVVRYPFPFKLQNQRWSRWFLYITVDCVTTDKEQSVSSSKKEKFPTKCVRFDLSLNKEHRNNMLWKQTAPNSGISSSFQEMVLFHGQVNCQVRSQKKAPYSYQKVMLQTCEACAHADLSLVPRSFEFPTS